MASRTTPSAATPLAIPTTVPWFNWLDLFELERAGLGISVVVTVVDSPSTVVACARPVLLLLIELIVPPYLVETELVVPKFSDCMTSLTFPASAG